MRSMVDNRPPLDYTHASNLKRVTGPQKPLPHSLNRRRLYQNERHRESKSPCPRSVEKPNSYQLFMKKHANIPGALAILIITRLLGTIFAADCQQTKVIQDGHYRLYTEELIDATNGVSSLSKSGILLAIEHGKVTVIPASAPQRLDGFSGSFDRAGDSTPWLLTLRRGDDSIVQFWKCLEDGVFLVRSVPDSGLRQLAMLEGGNHWNYDEVLNTRQFGVQQSPAKSTADPLFELTVSRTGPVGGFEQDIRTIVHLGQHFQLESWAGGTAVMRLSGTLDKRVGSENTFIFRNFGSMGHTGAMELVLEKPFTFGSTHGPSWSISIRRIENK